MQSSALARTSSARERSARLRLEREREEVEAETAADDGELQLALARIATLERSTPAAAQPEPQPEPEPEHPSPQHTTRAAVRPSDVGGPLLTARRLLAFGKVLHDRLGAACAGPVQAVPHDLCVTLARILALRVQAVVIDSGSGYTRAGVAGEDAPRSICRTVIGTMRHRIMVGMPGVSDWHVGEEALAKRGILQLRYPIEHGFVTHWEHMHKIWHHCFYSESAVQLAPEQQPILLSECILNPKASREKMTEVCFARLGCPAFFVAIQEVLALYAAGRSTGVVLTCGDGTCQAVPIYEGYSMPQGYDARILQTPVTNPHDNFEI